MHYGKSTPNYVQVYLHTERSESLISILAIWVRKIPIDAFDHGAMLSIHYQRKQRKWHIANAKSCVDVSDRLRECRMENIHARNTLVMAFSYVAVGLWYRYTIFFHFIYSNTVTCLATNLWRYLCTSL